LVKITKLTKIKYLKIVNFSFSHISVVAPIDQ